MNKKFCQVSEVNIDVFEVNKVNMSLDKNVPIMLKKSEIKFQNLQNLVLESINIISLLKDSLYISTKMEDLKELLDWIKGSFERCADSAMILGKLANGLLVLQIESITPELNLAYKHLFQDQSKN